MFKIWGSAMASLSVALKQAVQSEEVTASYGAPRFFQVRTLAIHRAFDAWCEKHNLDGSEIRQAMSKMRDQPTVNSVYGCSVLLDTLPPEFCVYGQWASQRNGTSTLLEAV